MNRLSASLSVPAAMAALLLAACGGGGGGGASYRAPAESPAFPVSYSLSENIVYSGGSGAGRVHGSGLTKRDVRHMPVWADRSALIVGIHPDAALSLSDTGSREVTDLRYGTQQDGSSRERLVRFMNDLYESGSVDRYPSPPVVRVVGEVTDVETDGVITALQLLNASLPDDWHLNVEFSPDRPKPPLSGGSDVPGEIILAFYANDEWHDESVLGYASSSPRLGAGQVWMNRVRNGAHVNTGSIVHEMIHALTDVLHVDDDGVRSIMHAEAGGRLSTIDRQFLYVLHTRLNTGDDPADFGPWDDTATYIHGSNNHTAFGVAMRGTPNNRYFEPWGSGWNPYRSWSDGGHSGLRQNSALTGTVTWNGALVGFTPAENPVVGDAAVHVNISSLIGSADFTSLEQWDAGTAPGSAGSGAMWGDGDLSYSLDIHGNRFRDGPGSADSGYLTGAFVGFNHEGVTGTLERDDLTAAFGASR